MTNLALERPYISWVQRPGYYEERRTLTGVPPTQSHFSATSAWSSGYPPWLSSCERRLEELRELRDGWDGHGGKALRDDVLGFVKKMIRQIAHPKLPEPQIVPLSYGGIQLEWHTRGIDFEIEIEQPYRILVFYESTETGDHLEFEIGDAPIDRLSAYLDRLAGR